MPPLYLTYKLKQLWSNQYETVFQINDNLHSNIFYGNGDWCNRLHRICASRDAPKHLAWTSIKKMGTLYSYLLIKFVLNISIIKNDTITTIPTSKKAHICHLSIHCPSHWLHVYMHLYVCMYVWINGWMDGWMDGRTDGWMDASMHACIYITFYSFLTNCRVDQIADFWKKTLKFI